MAMEKKSVNFSDILSSKGMEYVNRTHFRSHTFNIFARNTSSFIEALQVLSDPALHIKELGRQNKEESRQVLKDVVCLAHNFLTGSMTLVDHTRVFISDHYLGTNINKYYKEKIKEEFSSNLLTRFVQDLRNYMVHRGPIPLERSLHGTKQEKESDDHGGGLYMNFTSGFFLRRSQLLKWNKWNSEAKKFLDGKEEKIEFLPIVLEYRDIIYKFHEELDEILLNYHKDDIMLLEKMQEIFDEENK